MGDAPRELRPLLRFAKLPAAGAAVVRRALDADDDFRSRVAAVADEDDVGRPSWLFLHRPDGWEDELESLAADAAASEAAVDEAADEARATRRLARANERVARLEADVAAAREETAAVRRARHATAERAQHAEAERDALREEAARLRAEVERLSTALSEARAAAAEATRSRAEPPVPRRVEPERPEPVLPAPVDAAALRVALDAALAALGDAVSLLPPPVDQSGAAPPTSPAARQRRPRPAAPRRQPIPLPAGIYDDSAEAADHLVRTNGVVVLVDGYNATISAWPDLSLSEQRTRLVDALAELAARTGAEPTVVFDGAHEPTPAPRPARSPVRVLFSPPDVAADDVILQLVDAAPLHRPVVVASDDRAVQDGAARRGANVLSRSQLLAMLRRSAR